MGSSRLSSWFQLQGYPPMYLMNALCALAVVAGADSFDQMAQRHVAEAREQSLATCRERGIELSSITDADFLQDGRCHETLPEARRAAVALSKRGYQKMAEALYSPHPPPWHANWKKTGGAAYHELSFNQGACNITDNTCSVQLVEDWSPVRGCAVGDCYEGCAFQHGCGSFG